VSPSSPAGDRPIPEMRLPAKKLPGVIEDTAIQPRKDYDHQLEQSPGAVSRA
jgi:hypothetical protein